MTTLKKSKEGRQGSQIVPEFNALNKFFPYYTNIDIAVSFKSKENDFFFM